ncbi:PEPxxWA-CTERM sorting domain-containing protein [Phenylobacterium sp.]|uniref:PEPxxWA-CTERM sorting domain-containing protein n=1 Tax=Phenylobacterium sp. TaxID=1871053 RepID=UPI0025FA2CA0|nr:PEPxxWA-CTERM sorting domain-containing protein [Phenylobacterium sp.]MBX3483743.1 PEP-CTERM sorting domain-containing protein [Phenylobacterium sp.]MCW5758161.1 PEP-CTERM sorting domain-containing protein [Phenylobacterium sp.]
MKTVTKLLAGAVAAFSMSAASAQAAVFIGISLDGGSTISNVFSAADGTFVFNYDCTNTADCGGFEAVTVRGDAPPRPGVLHSDSVEVNASNTGAASIVIFVTRTDLAPLGDKQYQSYTTNNVGGGIGNSLSTLVSDSNELFAGVQIGSFSNGSLGAASVNSTTFFDLSGAGLYSVTHKYVLNAPSSGAQRSASPTIGLSVPEPATWALMIMGFGGAGAMLRTQRRKLAAAA